MWEGYCSYHIQRLNFQKSNDGFHLGWVKFAGSRGSCPESVCACTSSFSWDKPKMVRLKLFKFVSIECDPLRSRNRLVVVGGLLVREQRSG